MTRVQWTLQAVGDLEAIRDFIALDSPSRAHRFVERALNAVERIPDHPFAGRRIPEIRDESIREVFLGSYRVVYRVGVEEVVVLTVVHAARRFPRL